MHPEPEARGRTASADEIPRTAQRLAERAERAGWTVVTTFARGTAVLTHGAPGQVIDSVAVRLRRGDQRLVGLWENGKFRTGLSHSPLASLKSRELFEAVEAVQ